MAEPDRGGARRDCRADEDDGSSGAVDDLPDPLDHVGIVHLAPPAGYPFGARCARQHDLGSRRCPAEGAPQDTMGTGGGDPSGDVHHHRRALA